MTAQSRMRQNPKTVAIRFRAYRHCLNNGADMTTADLATALDVPHSRLQRALAGEQWARALRTSRLDIPTRPEFDGAAQFEAQRQAQDYLGVPA